MNEQNCIVANNVSVKKGKNTILNSLEFNIKKGCITGLVGPSGSGKTTLMRSIVGVQQLSEGELKILGLRAGSKELRHTIGYVTQSPAIYPDLTVNQNISYFASLVQASSKEVARIIDDVQLGRQRDQLTESLSGGQKARVSLAVALLGSPEILILDEPTVGLDPILREDLWNIFSKLAQSGKTILVSSHVMDEADRCDEVLLLRDGAILWNDSRATLLDATGANSVGDAFVSVIKSGGVK